MAEPGGVDPQDAEAALGATVAETRSLAASQCEMGKIQGFAKLLGDTVATILFLLLAAGMAGVGAWLTFLR